MGHGKHFAELAMLACPQSVFHGPIFIIGGEFYGGRKGNQGTGRITGCI